MRKPAVERVPFNVNNVEHRQAFAFFLENSKWGADAPRFLLEDAAPSIPVMITNKLLKFYINSDTNIPKVL